MQLAVFLPLAFECAHSACVLDEDMKVRRPRTMNVADMMHGASYTRMVHVVRRTQHVGWGRWG